MSDLLLYILLGAGGLVVGWSLNTVIVRLPEDGDLFEPGPECPECHAPLRGLDLVPVVSWVVRRGRCRACAEPIPLGYPLVEVGNAVLWVAAGVRFGASWVLIPFLLLFSTLLAQAVIDLETYRLLDRITFPVLGISIILVVVVSLVEDSASDIGLALAGMVGYFAFLFVPALISPKGMGLGDVKLAALMGLYLGWISPMLIFYALIIASLSGVVVGLVLWFARGRKNQPFPFGPWLAFGCVMAILFSEQLLP